jgi:hypothetical protein
VRVSLSLTLQHAALALQSLTVSKDLLVTPHSTTPKKLLYSNETPTLPVIALMHWLQIGQLVVLLTVANGAPVIAQKVLGNRWSLPLDAGKIWRDGKPVLGASKTIRGVTCSVAATMFVAPGIAVSWTVGLAVGAAAMAGDLFSSFVKRRLGLPASARATGLDQVPESLLPTLIFAYELKLEWLDVAIVTAIFFFGEIALSRLLYTLRIRARPY